MSVDLATLAAPDVIKALDYESVLAEIIADYQTRYPEYSANVESDPVYKLFEVAAERELFVRQRVNDGARALLLAHAAGTDLDHLAFTYYGGTTRLLVDAGDPAAIPPVPPIYESDDRLRQRCVLWNYALSTAGPSGAYIYHAMTADVDVKHAKPLKHTPAPGDVTIVILSATGDGTAAQPLIDIVQAALDDENVRPLNDTPIVQSAAIVNWTLDASLICYPDANTTLVLAEAQAAAEQFAADQHRMDYDINRSAIDAVLHVSGVQRVVITAPAADIPIDNTEAAWSTGIVLTLGGSAT